VTNYLYDILKTKNMQKYGDGCATHGDDDESDSDSDAMPTAPVWNSSVGEEVFAAAEPTLVRDPRAV